jgi:hypothetical protein
LTIYKEAAFITTRQSEKREEVGASGELLIKDEK